MVISAMFSMMLSKALKKSTRQFLCYCCCCCLPYDHDSRSSYFSSVPSSLLPPSLPSSSTSPPSLLASSTSTQFTQIQPKENQCRTWTTTHCPRERNYCIEGNWAQDTMTKINIGTMRQNNRKMDRQKNFRMSAIWKSSNI